MLAELGETVALGVIDWVGVCDISCDALCVLLRVDVELRVLDWLAVTNWLMDMLCV